MTILQNILRPTEGICEWNEMYFHSMDADGENRKTVYDGYFNMFNMGKWRAYTNVSDIYLKVEGKCDGTVYLISENGVQEEAATQNKSVTLKLGEDQFYWFAWQPVNTEETEVSGCFYTDEKPVKEVHLAADICTFRREAFVERNIRQLEKSILSNEASSLYGKLDVFIIDNGNTLSEDYQNLPGVHLFPNINAGGSGGFTRGILEINHAKEQNGYTHVILLDDDAVLEPDAFVRTWALLSFIKEEYAESCIGGAMLDLEDRFMQNECGVKYCKGKTTASGSHVDLRTREAVIKNEKENGIESDYNGWWFACFPLTVARPDNLPLPFFVHYDDMEYGLRNANGIIYLNGICIWHEGFDHRHSQAQTYYGIRNRYVTNALHTDVTLKEEKKICFEAITFDLLRFQYETADLCFEAVKDFCLGAKKFSRLDPVQMNDKARSLAGKFVPLDQLSDDPAVVQQIRDYCEKIRSGEEITPKVSKKKYIYTLNGWLLPAKKSANEVCCYSIFQPDMRELYRQKKAVLVDPYHGTGMWAKKSYRKLFHCLWTYVRISALLSLSYKKSAESFRRNMKKLTGEKFWQHYLKR